MLKDQYWHFIDKDIYEYKNKGWTVLIATLLILLIML